MRVLSLVLLVACATDPVAGPAAWSPASPAAPPPGEPLTLDLTPGILGGTLSADVGNADPGEPVHLVMSLYGSAPGSCHPLLGDLCLDLNAPVKQIRRVLSDGGGAASFVVDIPDLLAYEGTEVCFQAVARRGVDGADSVASPADCFVLGYGDDGGGPALPPGETMDAGNWSNCAVLDDGILCWGGDTFSGDLQEVWEAPTSGSFVQVQVGFQFACALDADGAATCWGNEAAWPDLVSPPDGTWLTLGAGAIHACALDMGGDVACWGYDEEGSVSDAPAGTFDQLSVGQYHSCVLDTDGYASCWGSDPYGAVSETPGDVHFAAIDAGWFHSCGVRLDDGTMECWGDAGEGRTSPPAGEWVQSSSEGTAACAVAADGALGCWGRVLDGVTDPPAGTWTETHTGTRHACARAEDGTIDCWGSSDYGQGDAPDTPGICTNFAPDDDGNGIPDTCE